MSVISSGVEAGDPEQVTRFQSRGSGLGRNGALRLARGAVGPIGGFGGHGSPSMTISSIPSISSSRTWTLCLSDVGRFLPT